jgi:anti-sigma regulatory factor (Ser/Thr protein kinase)
MARGLEMKVPATAENVAIVRHAVAGLAEAVGMDTAGVADLKTVVTEACMNVVVHAYEDDAPGPLEVTADPESDAVVVVVRDRGTGIRPRADVGAQSLRLGLPLIAALSTSFGISGGPGVGTEVTMRMALSRNGTAPDESPAASAEFAADGDGRPATELTMPADALLAPVLSRVISILAARANLPVDRLSDAVLLGDAIAAQAAGEFPEGRAQIWVDEEDGELSMRVGPLVDGGGDRLLEGMRIPELGGSLERLADEIRVEQDGGDEVLVLRVGPHA